MKKTLKISKMMLKGSSNPFEGDKGKSSKPMSLGMKLFIGFAILIGLASIVGLFGGFINYFLDQLILLNQAYLGVHFFLTALVLFTFIMAIIITPAVYYFDDSMESYLVLPITKREYLSAKWIVNVININYLLIPFILMFAAIFTYKVDGALIHLPIILIASFLVPLIPISAVVFFTVLLFKAVPFIRNRNIYVYFTSFIGLVFGLGINFMMTPMMENEGMMESIIAGLQGGEGNSLVNFVSSIIPTIGMFIKSMTQSNAFLFVGAILITVVIVFATILFTQYNYLDSALSMKESGHSGKQLSESKFSKASEKSSAFKALIRQDFRNIMRTPIFASNYFIPMLIVPIMIPMGIIGTDFSFDALKDLAFQFDVLMSFVDFGTYLAFTIVIFTLIGYGLGSFSTVTSTAFSREGTNMQSLLQLPVPLLTVLNAKLVLGMMVTGILPVILVILLQILLKTPILIFITALISSLIGVACANVASIFLDVLKPKLVWANDQEAVKQNLLAIIPMFTSFAVVGIAFWLLFQDATTTTYLAYILLIILVSIASYFFLRTKGMDRLKDAIQEM